MLLLLCCLSLVLRDWVSARFFSDVFKLKGFNTIMQMTSGHFGLNDCPETTPMCRDGKAADGPERGEEFIERSSTGGRSTAPTAVPVTKTKRARPHIKRAGDDYGIVKSPKTFIHASYEGRRLKLIMIRATTKAGMHDKETQRG